MTENILGFCCVKYQVCGETSAWTLDVISDDATMFAAAVDSSCSGDYLAIEGSSSTCGLGDATNRYCGQSFADATGALTNLEICGMLSFF